MAAPTLDKFINAYYLGHWPENILESVVQIGRGRAEPDPAKILKKCF
jgi:hypothetical protein